jgi:hypothetical protein
MKWREFSSVHHFPFTFHRKTEGGKQNGLCLSLFSPSFSFFSLFRCHQRELCKVEAEFPYSKNRASVASPRPPPAAVNQACAQNGEKMAPDGRRRRRRREEKNS